MKKRNLMVALLCSMCLVASTPMPTMADAAKVVTLGADLSEAQKNTMMKYFKTDSSQVQIISVTNQDEHNYLGKYVPSEQIGTRTVSCAYVRPTQSGGIKVRTANLNYVTCNMIATALSTAGVTNCEAVAACPMEVSGTGALTGVMMAYETASGKKLDSTKKDLATKEVVVTGNVGTQVGRDNATNIINQAKMQIIGDNIQSADEIYNIVNNIAVQNGITLTADELNAITELLKEIAQQRYDIQEMQKTLESIQKNLEDSKAAAEGDEVDNSDEDNGDEDDGDEAGDGEDITQDVDPDAIGSIIETSTEDANLAQETGANTNEPEEAEDEGSYDTSDDSTDEGSAEEGSADESTDNGTGIPDATGDGTYDNGNDSSWGTDGASTDESNGESTDSADQNAEGSYTEDTDGSAEQIPDAGTDESTDNGEQIPDESGEDTAGTSDSEDALSAEDQGKYDQAQQFCQGEYTGDMAILQGIMPDPAQPVVTLDNDTATKLTKKVLEAYKTVLKDGGMTYVPSETDSYTTSQVNMLDTTMKQIFSIETEPAGDDILVNVSQEDRQTLYDDTMSFFAYLYNDTKTDATEESADETAGEEGSEDTGYDENAEYDESGY